MSNCTYGGAKYNVQGLLNDPYVGATWYHEPSLKAVVAYQNREVVVNGTFRHVMCRRISISNEPFSNLTCSMCKGLVHEGDFRKRVMREEKSIDKPGVRETSR
jgi:hypothetical protein